jgi:hypothetical protein
MTRPGRMLATPVARRVAALPVAPLPAAERSYFERRLQANFSDVRVHAGPEASALAAAIGAKAFAVGEHIVFGDGHFAPGAGSGRRLLAHELAHVAQQQRGGSSSAAVEPRAKAAAAAAIQGETVSRQAIGGAEPGVHCEPEDEEKKEPTDTPQPTSPLPPFQLKLTDPIDWRSMRGPYGARGVPFTLRDVGDIQAEWERSSRTLDLFGITDKFKLGFITKDWILNQGISKQVEDRLIREHPNAIDRLQQRWEQEHPGGFKTPIIPLWKHQW